MADPVKDDLDIAREEREAELQRQRELEQAEAEAARRESFSSRWSGEPWDWDDEDRRWLAERLSASVANPDLDTYAHALNLMSVKWQKVRSLYETMVAQRTNLVFDAHKAGMGIYRIAQSLNPDKPEVWNGEQQNIKRMLLKEYERRGEEYTPMRKKKNEAANS